MKINGKKYINPILNNFPDIDVLYNVSHKIYLFLVQYAPERIAEFDKKQKLNWEKISNLLAEYSPEYLEYYRSKILWNYVGSILAEVNPEYLEVYRPFLPNWKSIAQRLASHNPEYLDKFTIKYSYDTWISILHRIATHNPEYLEKYKLLVDKYKIWDTIIGELLNNQPKFLKKYIHNVKNWDNVFSVLGFRGKEIVEPYKEDLKQGIFENLS